MESSLISVIVPVYNTEKYISRCLDSILNSSYRNIEVICINDGSTDASLKGLKKYEMTDKRIRVIDQPNGGVSHARNEGLKIAKGEWISFIDSDDFIHRDFFKTLMKMQRETNADVVGCNAQNFENENKVKFELQDLSYRIVNHEQILNEQDCRQFKRSVWGKVYCRELIGENVFLNGLKTAEDTTFNLNVLFQKEDLIAAFTEMPLYFYFMRENSAIHTQSQSGMYRAIKEVYLPNLNNYPTQELKNMILEQAIRTLLSTRYLNSFENDNDNVQSECKKLLKRCIGEIKDIPMLKKVMYIIFYQTPFTYRIWRIVNDPTMLAYERKIKETFS